MPADAIYDRLLREIGDVDFFADQIHDVALDSVDRERPWHADMLAQTIRAQVMRDLDRVPYDAWMRYAEMMQETARETLACVHADTLGLVGEDR